MEPENIPDPLAEAAHSKRIADRSMKNARLPIQCACLALIAALSFAANAQLLTTPGVSGLSITSSPQSGDTYAAGETISASVTFSATLSVTGSPQLALSIGTNTRQASYGSCTSTSPLFEGSCQKLSFSYKVQSADSDTDGLSIASNALTLNGGTIQDSFSNTNANLSIGLNAITDDSSHKVDGSIDRAPTVSSLAFNSSPEGGATYIFNETISLTVGFNEPVTVTGSPQLALTIDSQIRQAGYVRCSGNPGDASGTCRLLYFSYVVQSTDSDTDGLSIAANALTLNSGTIRDSGSNNAVLTLSSHVISNNASHKIDGSNRLPAVSNLSITSRPQSGDTYGIGETISAIIQFNEPVKVTGSPQLALAVGSQDRQANYSTCFGLPVDSTGSCRWLTFSYKVQSTDSDSDGIGIATNALTLNSGMIRDLENRNATLDLGSSAIDRNASHKVDGSIDRAPTVSGLLLSSRPSSANTYAAGETIAAVVQFIEPVDVSGSPQLKLTIGSEIRQAAYLHCTAGPGDAMGFCRFLYFRYMVESSDLDADGIGIAVDALQLNAGTIQDAGSNNADLSLGSYAIDNDPSHKVDGIPPEVATLYFSSRAQSDDTYGIGETIAPVVGFNEPVMVTGSPQLELAIGSQARQATYVRCAGNAGDAMGTCRFLHFSYVVQSLDLDADGLGIAANALALNSGTIRDAVNDANLNLGNHAISDATDQKVDGVTPTVASLSIDSSPQSGDAYGVGEMIAATVGFNEPITVAGRPQLQLTIGSQSPQASYSHCFSSTGDPPGSCRFLVFHHSVRSSDSDPNGISIAANALTLNGSTIRDAGGNNAARALGSHAISNDASHKVDGNIDRTPTVSNLLFDSRPQSGDTYGVGELIKIWVEFNEPVAVAGQPLLALTMGTEERLLDNMSCIGNASDPQGTCRWLSFRYLVGSADRDPDGIGIAANALTLESGTIRDASGNDANLGIGSHAIDNASGHKVDGSSAGAPAVAGLSFASTPRTGNVYGIGETIMARVAFDKPIQVSGHPQLALTIGNQARMADYSTCVDDSGTRAEICWLMSFRYLVQSSDSDSDGVGIATSALQLNGGHIRDAAGNHAELGLGLHAIANDPKHKVDGNSDHAPAVASLSFDSLPQSGDTYSLGEIVIAAVEFNELVAVSGRPQLTLTIDSGNRLADYRFCDPGAGGATGTCRRLHFSYAVQPSDRDSDGIGIAADALRLNSGAIRDLNDNGAELGFGRHAINQDATRKIDGSAEKTAVATRLRATAPIDGVRFGGGETIRVAVRFSKAVRVSGRPQLKLDVGQRIRQAAFASRNDLGDLVFEYTVRSADAGLQGLMAIAADALTLNGGTIRDEIGREADLSLAGLALPSYHVYVPAPRPPSTPSNKPPEVASKLEDIWLQPDAEAEADLTSAFRDPNDHSLSYAAASANPKIATVRVADNAVRIAGWRPGATRATVTATDSGGLSASQSFVVTVGQRVSFASDVSVPEGHTAHLTVELSGPLPKTLELDYHLGPNEDPTTADADENDHEGRDGILTIPAGETRTTIEIPIGDDADIEPAREVFTLRLGQPKTDAGATLGLLPRATVTIEEGVCDRTAEVRDELRGERDCTEVTDQDLAARASLDLSGQGINALKAKDFLNLSGLRTLRLANNWLTQWPAEALVNSPELSSLNLDGNRLQALSANAFAALPTLTSLHLANNQLSELPARSFAGLPNLRTLNLDGNDLTALAGDVFAKLANLGWLHLSNNELSELPANLFAGLEQLRTLHIQGNELSELPAGLFEGLTGLQELQMQDNPGAPFALMLEARRTDGADSAAPGPAELRLALDEGAPFEMSVQLSARGGTLTAASASLAAGQRLSEPAFRLTPDGDGAATVGLEEVSGVPGNRCGEFEPYPCYQGVTVVAGPPLVLFKRPPTVEAPIPAQTLESFGNALRLDLSRFVLVAEDEMPSCEAISSDPGLVAASAADCMLRIIPGGDGEGGKATIRVTVTDGDGLNTTLSFEVTVRPAPRRLTRAWRWALLIERAADA